MAGLGSKRRVEMMFHIDENFERGTGLHDKEGFVPPVAPAQALTPIRRESPGDTNT